MRASKTGTGLAARGGQYRPRAELDMEQEAAIGGNKVVKRMGIERQGLVEAT